MEMILKICIGILVAIGVIELLVWLVWLGKLLEFLINDDTWGDEDE